MAAGGLALPVGASTPATSTLAQDPDPPTVDQTDSSAAAVEESPREPEAISEERSNRDEGVRSSLQAIFDRVPSLDAVTVNVEAGIVRLQGQVADGRVAERAAALAEAQEGVLWVENEIVLSTSLSEQLDPTWERLREATQAVLVRIPLMVVALAIVGLALFVGGRLGRWGGPSFLHTSNPFLQSIVGRAIQVTVVLFGVVLALDLLEATALVGAVAGTAGLAGLALGFAFKDIVENYLAGLLMAVRRPFDKNDHVVVDSHEGKVVRLTPRETILMTPEGNHVRMPNALVFRSPMLNFTRNPRRRFSFEAGVGAGDDLVVAREVGIGVLREMHGVLDDPPPEALVTALGDSWITMRFLGWVDQRHAEFGRVRSEAIRLVKKSLENAGITMPSPEYTVRMPEGEVSPEKDRRTREVETGESPEAAIVTDVQADVSPDDAVDRQIAEDRRVSEEEDLLERR